VQDGVVGGPHAGIALRVLDLTPSDADPRRPVDDERARPSRNAAAQRRAMQAAMANAVRAMRSMAGRTPPRDDARRRPPADF
jgi:hypothetical protein